MDCIFYWLENKVSFMRLGLLIVLHHSLPLMNSFNKNETAIFCVKTPIPYIIDYESNAYYKVNN